MLVDPIVSFQSQKMISTSLTERIFSQYEICNAHGEKVRSSSESFFSLSMWGIH